MAWSSTGTQSGTDTTLASITSVTGVTVNVSANGHKTYQVPTTVGLLTVTGTLSWDSDYETLECSESTRMEVNAGASVTIGKASTINGKTRWSRGTGLIMNRQQGTPFINTSAVNIWVKAGASLAAGGKFIVNGSRIMSGGGIFCGNSTSPTGNFVTFELNGSAVMQNISKTQIMQMVRCFCEPSGINLYSGRIDGRELGGLPFSNAGWGTLSVSLEYGNFQCDGNGPTAPVTVPNAELVNNVSSFDYAYVANANDLTRINKYIFQNSDVGSGLRTLGQTSTTWRIGVVEITKDVVISAVDTNGTAVENAVTYMQLGSASLNPAAGSRYAGIDDYVTPRVYIKPTASTGLTELQNVLYAVAQGYSTSSADNGTTPLTMDALCSRTNDVQDGFIWSYGHLVGQPTVAMRGTGTVTQAWTLFDDPSITLSRTAALALIGTKFSFDVPNKRVTQLADATLSEFIDACKAFKCSTTRANIEAPTIGNLIATANGDNVLMYTDWNYTINSGATLSALRYKQLTLQGTGLVTVNGTIAVPYKDADGLRVTVTNLDPEGFGNTWFLRHKLQSGSTWTNVSGTGNTALILLNEGAYDLQVRSPGYEWESDLTLDTAVSLILNAGLRYHVSANNTPQWEMPFTASLEEIFQYDAVEMKVSVENETGTILQPGFAELYRATQRIQHIPDLVWSWTAPVTANSTSQKIIIPVGNPISMYLTNDSTASVKITAPVIHADTSQSADDRVRGNTDGFSIILGSPATAESAGLQAGIVAALGGANYTTEDHSLVSIVGALEVSKAVIDLIKTATDAIKAKTDVLENYDDSTTQTKLDALDTAVDLTLKAADYTAPDNASITAIKDKVDTLENTDVSSLATASQIDALNDITAADVVTAMLEVADDFKADVSELALEATLADKASQQSVNELGTPLQASDYLAPRNDDIVAIKQKTDTLVNAPTVADIEASTVLAKEATLANKLDTTDYVEPDNTTIAEIKTKVDSLENTDVSELATSAEIQALNNLSSTEVVDAMLLQADSFKADVSELTTSDEIVALSTMVGNPLQADDYVAPDNATILEIKTKVDSLENTDLTEVNSALTEIKGAGFNATKHNLVKIKQDASLAAALSAL